VLLFGTVSKYEFASASVTKLLEEAPFKVASITAATTICGALFQFNANKKAPPKWGRCLAVQPDLIRR
jgi:hypothetical protein